MKTQHGTTFPEPIVPGAPPSLFDVPAVFDGDTFEPDQDATRLSGLLARVYDYLACHDWVSLRELSEGTGGTEASVSARLRDLRKPAFGAHTIRRERVPGQNGLFLYRLEQ